MRIKSYFAPSVQAAIALARKEFGEDVTLVTSHVASLDNRHLGEYEVVFAIEEAIVQPEPVAETIVEPIAKPIAEAAPPVFHQLLQQAIEAPPAPDRDPATRLEDIHSSLVALGLEAALVRSFMTMLKAVLPVAATSSAPELPLPAAEERPAPSKSKVVVIKPEPASAPRPFLALFETARPEPSQSSSSSSFSAAELAFMSSVSSPKQEKA